MTSRIELINFRFFSVKQLIAALLLILMHCTGARAEADGPDYWRVVGVAANDTLHIRAQPDANSAKLGEIPPNGNCIINRGCKGGLSFEEYSSLNQAEKAKRLSENPRWCLVEYKGLTGWVAGRYLGEGDCP